MTVTNSLRSRATRFAAAGAALMAFSLVAAPASAQSFLDPADPCPPGVEVSPAPFSDRDSISETHRRNVDCAAALDVVLGTNSGEFMPADSTRRDQMASFIVRGLEAAGYDLPTPSDQGFTDISGNEHEDNINILAEIGVTEGTSSTTFTPAAQVRRDQMASFMLRAAEFAFEDEDGLDPSQPNPFEDVQANNVHVDNIAAANELLGLTAGVTEDTFEPWASTRRDQMATFVVRLIDVTLIANY